MLNQSYYDTIDKLDKNPPLAIVSISSGAGSACAAQMAIEQFGRSNTKLIFMDTQWEDEDNYRFLWDVATFLDMPITVLTEGRTPLEVAKDEHIIPNQKIAPCTHRLKIGKFINYIEAFIDSYDVVVVLGIGANENRRMPAPKRRYESIGAKVWYPLATVPYEPKDIIRAWGVPLPRMYEMGYKHANCGGRCVKQGKRDWRRTLENFPERYAEAEQWETEMRKDERFKDYAMLRDQRGGTTTALPLSEFRAEIEQRDVGQPKLWDMLDDQYGCTTECGVA